MKPPEPVPDPTPFTPGSLTIAPTGPPTPPQGPGNITVLKDCSSVDISLELLPQHPVTTHYTIVLEVKDSAGLTGQDLAAVTIQFVTG